MLQTLIDLFKANKNIRNVALGVALSTAGYISSKLIKKTKPVPTEDEQSPIKESEIENNHSVDSLAEIDESVDSSMESEESTKEKTESDESDD